MFEVLWFSFSGSFCLPKITLTLLHSGSVQLNPQIAIIRKYLIQGFSEQYQVFILIMSCYKKQHFEILWFCHLQVSHHFVYQLYTQLYRNSSFELTDCGKKYIMTVLSVRGGSRNCVGSNCTFQITLEFPLRTSKWL